MQILKTQKCYSFDNVLTHPFKHLVQCAHDDIRRSAFVGSRLALTPSYRRRVVAAERARQFWRALSFLLALFPPLTQIPQWCNLALLTY